MANIVFTGGGTAGHYAPNYALMPLVRSDFDRIYYMGSKFGPEKEAASREGVEYFGITCAKLNRSLDFKNAL
ncbi:MAG: glycosyltransferase, partial [Clostridia bacterium]|nr:glycosyltransferase [Clostridia bacterium]